MTDRPGPDPLLLRARQVCQLVGVSKATWDRQHAAGKVPAPVRLGAGVFWNADVVRAWVAAGCPDRRSWEARHGAGKNQGKETRS